MVAMVLLALSPRLQPGEHYPHYSHGARESIHSEEFFSIREIVHLGVCDLCALVMVLTTLPGSARIDAAIESFANAVIGLHVVVAAQRRGNGSESQRGGGCR